MEHEAPPEALIQLSDIMSKAPDGHFLLRSSSTEVAVGKLSYQPDASIVCLKKKGGGDDGEEDRRGRIPAIVFESNFANDLTQAKRKSASWVLFGKAQLCVLTEYKLDREEEEVVTLTIYTFRLWNKDYEEVGSVEKKKKLDEVYYDEAQDRYYAFRAIGREPRIYKVSTQPGLHKVSSP